GGTLNNQAERSQPSPSRSDLVVKAQLIKLAKKGQSSGSAGGSQTIRAGASPHMLLGQCISTPTLATWRPLISSTLRPINSTWGGQSS
ncbi:unnamed protein product, partial [Prunus brigantina]